MIRIILTFAVLVITTKLMAQPLKIGDKVPDFYIGKIINYPKESIRFSDIKARLVILDFWAIGCGSCIEAMPKMDALQKKFGDKIFILAANHQPADIATNFWMKNSYLKSTSIPNVVGDTILQKYTPWVGGAGLHVWILDGKILAYPNSVHATEKNISDVLAGVPKNWDLAVTTKKYYDVSKSILDGGSLPLPLNNSGNFFSMITPYNPYFRIASYDNLADSTTKSSRIVAVNFTAMQLYLHALQYLFEEKYSAVKVKSYDESLAFKLGITEDEEWSRNNTYCYEAVLLGKLTRQQMGEYMLSDLNKLLALNGKIEKKQEEFWTLSLKPGVIKIKDNVDKGYMDASRERDRVQSKFPYPSLEFKAFNESEKGQKLNRWAFFSEVQALVDFLSVRNDQKIVVNNLTGYSERVNLTIPVLSGRKYTLDELSGMLDKHGFELKRWHA